MASATATTAAGEGAAPGRARAERSRSSAQPAADGSRAASLPPGPRAHPIVQTLAWAFAPTWLMDTCAERVGDSFTITFWPSRFQLALVSDPEAVKATFTAPPEIAPSGAGNSPIASVMGPHSVITLTGAEHMRQRKLLLPPFHGERMRDYEDVIVQETRRDMASWPIGTPMRLHERTRKITLEVILRAIFGVEAERMEELREAIWKLLEPANVVTILRAALGPPSLERPGGSFGRALDHLDAVIYEELRRRRAQADLAERNDILSLLLQARDEDGEQMTDEELRDELVSLLLAGHETTATSVAWAIERLVRHPEKLRRLQAEIDARASGEANELGQGTGEEYLTAVVQETLRVRPVVPIVVRVLQEDFEIGGRVLPAGTRVTPSIYLANRNARVYEDAKAFRPERYLEGAPETFSWIPFGGGIRRCIGAAFAQLEMRLMLRTMLSELDPSVPPRSVRFRRAEWIRRRAITLVPADGARVVWQRRRPPA